MVEVLLKVNNYVLVRFEELEDGEVMFSYGSIEYLQPDREFVLKGNKDFVIRGLKYCLKENKKKFEKYDRKKATGYHSAKVASVVIDWLWEQRKALTEFLEYMETVEEV